MANKIYDTMWYESWRKFYYDSLVMEEEFYSPDNDEEITLSESVDVEKEIEQEIAKLEKQFKKSIQKLKNKIKEAK